MLLLSLRFFESLFSSMLEYGKGTAGRGDVFVAVVVKEGARERKKERNKKKISGSFVLFFFFLRALHAICYQGAWSRRLPKTHNSQRGGLHQNVPLDNLHSYHHHLFVSTPTENCPSYNSVVSEKGEKKTAGWGQDERLIFFFASAHRGRTDFLFSHTWSLPKLLRFGSKSKGHGPFLSLEKSFCISLWRRQRGSVYCSYLVSTFLIVMPPCAN